MMSPPDPFTLHFDSIPVGPQRHDATDLGDEPAQSASLTSEAPGFYLVDDANGRFSIERDTGIVTLAHEHLLSIEAGAIHQVHIRAVEMSGASYDMKLRLRMTGRVPQIAGAEENDALAGLAAAPLMDLLTPEQKSVQEIVTPEPPALPWVKFSAAQMLAGKPPLYGETAVFGTLFETPVLPDVYLERGVLALDAAPPAPAPVNAAWAL